MGKPDSGGANAPLQPAGANRAKRGCVAGRCGDKSPAGEARMQRSASQGDSPPWEIETSGAQSGIGVGAESILDSGAVRLHPSYACRLSACTGIMGLKCIADPLWI
ncbi:MAG: hypothetical protein A3H91_06290 [Gammaproteobacteria bacterium RIFCSPLOWO2_02_FULL_61_13]|nr:MAG: hypothetical protein A3H91_06290 [Gammaproteobacteria bacterium RIFCSPLOWO2_02_FULL_61_13]